MGGAWDGFGGFGADAGAGARAGAGAGARARPPAQLGQHLSTFGLATGADGGLPKADDVRKAYRRLALSVHPDKPGGSKETFQQLQTAYKAVLGALGAACSAPAG